jgi:hypothetical protein
MHKTFALHNGSGDTKSFSSGLLRNSVHSNHLLSIRLHFGFLALAVLASSLVLSGCGGLTSGSGGSSTPTANTTDPLAASPSSIDFGAITVGNSGNTKLTVTNQGTTAIQVTQLTFSSSSFSADGEGNLPLTLAAGDTLKMMVHFEPTGSSDTQAQLTITSQPSPSTTGSVATSTTSFASSKSSTWTTTVKLHGKGATAGSITSALSGLSCSKASMSGTGTDPCTVTLSAKAPIGGFSVNISSGNAAVTVPSIVTVPASATSVGFTASVAAVGSSQAVTLSANANSVTKTYALQLNSAAAVPMLSINAGSVTFGSVVLNSKATQPVTLTSAGTAPVIVSSATVSGTGFSVSGITFPLTLNPGQTATLNVQFDPTAAGATTGKLTIASNSAPTATAVLSLSGTGAPHQVDLSWVAPSTTTDPAVGYNIYRSPGGASAYALVNPTHDSQTSYADTTVQSGASYDYIVKSVDAAGVESAPSNMTSVTIP